ncbi:ribbon-helix-helix domain-containing protein [Roseovarius sp. E0-M6]|uniref:ribbon-helix-helix domain-containing protein n=1 Tax=Roseovarius sp. E0-M6 TaxID=3127118 RepID=UPI00300FBE96
MSARPVKHSLTLRGHRTSVSLEEPFWHAFREIARERGMPLNELAAEIDAARAAGDAPDSGLASAIRVHVLDHYRAAARRGTPET